MACYITLKEKSEFTYEDRKSVFLGFAFPIKTENEALQYINAIKKKFSDARHWVYAYCVRENNVMRFTDDREPQGTAGMPILDVIRKNQVTDALIVVVRYFGGILLGTGGLVHAYTETAVGALKKSGVIRYDLYSDTEILLGYSDYQKLNAVFSDYDFYVVDTEYSEEVKIIGNVLSERKDDFKNKLIETTSGRCKIVFKEEKYNFREKN